MRWGEAGVVAPGKGEVVPLGPYFYFALRYNVKL